MRELIDVKYCLSELDYELGTTQERIELLNKLLYDENGYPKEYFEKMFDQDERERILKDSEAKENNQKYINLLPTTKQLLSSDIYECKGIETMANYLLFAPDQPRMDKQQEYNFYDQEEFDKVVKAEYKNLRDKSELGETRERYNKNTIKNYTYLDKDGKMAYLKRMDENSKCDGRQKMYKKDYKDPELRDYILPLEKTRSKLYAELKLRETIGDITPQEKTQYKRRLTNLIQHQEDYKTYIKGMFEFKNPLPDSTVTDYSQFNIEDTEQILSMLFLGRRYNVDDDLSCMTIDFENILNKILCDERYPKLTQKEQFVLDNIKNNGSISQDEMAYYIGEDFGEKYTQQRVSRIYEQIAKKITEAHYQQLKDFLVEFRKEGIKKCNRCQEWKLVEDFRIDKSKADGLRYNCKKCDKNM